MNTLEIVVDQQTMDDLTPVCKFAISLPGQMWPDPCGKSATHFTVWGCGEVYFACDEHAEFSRSSRCVVICSHGPCKIIEVVKL